MSQDTLARIDAELEGKRRELDDKQCEVDALRAEVDDLEHAAAVLRAVPNHSLLALESAARVLRRIVGDADPGSATSKVAPDANGAATVPPRRHRKRDLAGVTIEEAAATILHERREPVHFRKLAQEAMERGYSSGRKDTEPKKVERSFAQTLGRIAFKGGEFERGDNGEFKLRTKPKAEEG